VAALIPGDENMRDYGQAGEGGRSINGAVETGEKMSNSFINPYSSPPRAARAALMEYAQ
jgi:hypothetical protein